MKVLFLGHVWAHYRPALEERLGKQHDLVFFGSVSEAGLPEAVEGAHVIVTNVLPEALGGAARQVRLVHAGGAGVNRIHMEAVATGVPLCRTLHHGPSMAEHAVMVILALHRDLLGLDRDLRVGQWRNAAYGPREMLQPGLDGKTAVILGTGEIGGHVAARCRALGLHRIGVNRGGRAPEGGDFDEVRPWTALDETLPRADVLIVAVPLTDETQGLVDARRLGLMKKESFLVALSRGPVVEEAALFAALQQRRIAGAAIDVWYRYPRSPGATERPSAFPFEELSNVIMTPHSSGMTEATFDRRVEDIIANIERLERGESPRQVVAVGGRRDP